MSALAGYVLLGLGAASLAALVWLLLKGVTGFVAYFAILIGSLCTAVLAWLLVTGFLYAILDGGAIEDLVILAALVLGAFAGAIAIASVIAARRRGDP